MKYLTMGLAIALSGAVGVAAIQTARLGSAKTELAAANSEITRLLEADSGKEKTIQIMEAAIGKMKAAALAQQEEMASAVAKLAQQAQLIEVQRAALAAEEVKEYEDPDCAAFLDLDVASVCPAHADSVRKRAARRLP